MSVSLTEPYSSIQCRFPSDTPLFQRSLDACNRKRRAVRGGLFRPRPLFCAHFSRPLRSLLLQHCLSPSSSLFLFFSWPSFFSSLSAYVWAHTVNSSTISSSLSLSHSPTPPTIPLILIFSIIYSGFINYLYAVSNPLLIPTHSSPFIRISIHQSYRRTRCYPPTIRQRTSATGAKPTAVVRRIRTPATPSPRLRPESPQLCHRQRWQHRIRRPTSRTNNDPLRRRRHPLRIRNSAASWGRRPCTARLRAHAHFRRQATSPTFIRVLMTERIMTMGITSRWRLSPAFPCFRCVEPDCWRGQRADSSPVAWPLDSRWSRNGGAPRRPRMALVGAKNGRIWRKTRVRPSPTHRRTILSRPRARALPLPWHRFCRWGIGEMPRPRRALPQQARLHHSNL